MKKFAVLLLSLFLNSIAHGQEECNIFNLQWQIDKNKVIEAHVGDKVILKFELENVLDFEIVDIEIWSITNNDLKDLIAQFQGMVNHGTVEIEWIIKLDLNNENTNYGNEIKMNDYAIIDYFFNVKYKNIDVSSDLLSIMSWIHQLVIIKGTGEPVINTPFFIVAPDNEIIEGATDADGYIKLYRLKKIGTYKITI